MSEIRQYVFVGFFALSFFCLTKWLRVDFDAWGWGFVVSAMVFWGMERYNIKQETNDDLQRVKDELERLDHIVTHLDRDMIKIKRDSE